MLHMQLEHVPQELKFEYMRSFQRLMDIRDTLSGFDVKTDKDKEILKTRLTEYRQFFKRISDINAIICEKV